MLFRYLLHAHKRWNWLRTWHLFIIAWVKRSHVSFRLFAHLTHQSRNLHVAGIAASLHVDFSCHLTLAHHSLNRCHRLGWLLIGLVWILIAYAFKKCHWRKVRRWVDWTILVAIEGEQILLLLHLWCFSVVVVVDRDSWGIGCIHLEDLWPLCLLNENVNGQRYALLFLAKLYTLLIINGNAWIMSDLRDDGLIDELVNLLAHETLNDLIWRLQITIYG